MPDPFIVLSKILPLLVYPLGLACLLLFISFFLFRRPNWVRTLTGLALALLVLGGNSWVADALARSLEWRHLPPAEIPEAQAIVVLGGATLSDQEPRPIVEINSAGDRLLYAAWLYRQGKAERVLLSGGRIDWLSEEPAPAEDMAELLCLMGVPREAMWLETASRNTYENAVYSREILETQGIERILLVTSAMHMPRAFALFERQGLEVIPAPTDFNVTRSQQGLFLGPNPAAELLNLFPSAGDLSLTSLAMKEYLGLFAYRLRGWL